MTVSRTSMTESASASPAPLWATLVATFFGAGRLHPGPGTWGSAATTSAGVTAFEPRLTGLKLSPRKVRNGHKETISFSLNAPSQVTFSLRRLEPGAKLGKRCVARKGKHKHGKKCTRTLRARGGDVVLVRFPASGPVYSSEERSFPRSLSWEPLLRATNVTGVNFADYPQLQGYNLPEWSHMSAADAPRFTRALADLIVRCIAHPDSKETPPAICATKGSDLAGRYGYR